MTHTTPLTVMFALAIQGCAMERTVSKTPDNRACVANYSTEGGFWTGKQFKTYEDFPKESKASAVDNLVATIASSGYQITNSNKELGIISANQTVSYGQGKTVPLNAVVKENPSGGVQVALVLSLSGGLTTSADSVQTEFCKILSSVDHIKEVSTPTPEVVTPKEMTPSPGKAKKKK
jgi:hypothetical protein